MTTRRLLPYGACRSAQAGAECSGGTGEYLSAGMIVLGIVLALLI